MKIDSLDIHTKITRISSTKVNVVVTCNNEVLDQFDVKTDSKLDIAKKALACIEHCTTKLWKYR